jgi:hypothetical protein
MGFVQHLYLLALRNESDTLWIGIGFLGQAVFGVRFLIQWLRSEQAGHSVVPIAFWYCSLVGGLVSFTYAVHLQASPHRSRHADTDLRSKSLHDLPRPRPKSDGDSRQSVRIGLGRLRLIARHV